jgi:hypothetical protein
MDAPKGVLASGGSRPVAGRAARKSITSFCHSPGFLQAFTEGAVSL